MKNVPPSEVLRFAGMFSAIGNESRLRIVQLLLSAHPGGLVAGEIQAELGITASNLSHHLEKLRYQDLVEVRREGSFLRYTANTTALARLLGFLYAECCSRSCAVTPEQVMQLKGRSK